MTVSATDRVAGPFLGNGIINTFNFDFKTFSKGDLQVVLTLVSDGSESTLVLDSDYSVLLNVDQDNDPGGTITYPLVGALMSASYELTINSEVTYKQATDIANLSGFYPQVIENALDYVTMLCQQLNDREGRTLQYRVSDTGRTPVIELPTSQERVDKVLGFDANGDLTVYDPSSAVTSGANVSFTVDSVYAAARTALAKMREEVSITDFQNAGGSVVTADSVTDNYTGIQRAIDYVANRGGGVVKVPAAAAAGAYYRVTRRVIVKSGVQLVGEGYGSFIKNDRTVQVTPGDQSVIGWGGYSGTTPRRVDDETFYDCNNITGGARTITTTTAGDAANFAAGDIVFIRNNTSDPTEANRGLYTHNEMNEVESAVAGTGVVTLRYPHYQSASTVKMAKSSGALTDQLLDAIQIRKNTRVANLRLENYYDATFGVFVFGGMFNSIIENIWLNASSAFSFNAHTRCTIRNIKGVVSQKLVDHAYWSAHNTYLDLDVDQGTTPASTDFKITFGEMSHDALIARSRVNGGAVDKFIARLAVCNRVTMRDCDLIGYGCAGGTQPLRLDGNGATSYSPDGCVVDNVRVYVASPTDAIYYDNAAETSPNASNIIKGCTVYGTPTNALTITATSKKAVVENNVWPSLKITNASTDSSIILRNNITLTQNYEVRHGQVSVLSAKGADTDGPDTYTVAQNGCSATGGWRIRAWGTATTGAGAVTRRVRFLLDGNNYFTLNLEANMAGKSWCAEMTVLNTALNAQVREAFGRIGDTTGPNSTEYTQVGTPAAVDFGAGAKVLKMDYQLNAVDTSITLRGWEVIPFGHDKA